MNMSLLDLDLNKMAIVVTLLFAIMAFLCIKDIVVSFKRDKVKLFVELFVMIVILSCIYIYEGAAVKEVVGKVSMFIALWRAFNSFANSYKDYYDKKKNSHYEACMKEMHNGKEKAKYTLRECRRDDEDFIYHLKEKGFRWYLKDITGWSESKQRKIIKQEMDEHLQDMNIIRYNFEDVGLFTYYADENGDIFIDMIVLLPECRGLGIGTQLLEYLIVTNPHKRIYLRTYKENPARKLYMRHGFEKYKENDNYWWMEKRL